MTMVPKGPRAEGAKVRDIDSARSKGGRPSGWGYDPETGEEHITSPQTDPDDDVFKVIGGRGYSEDRFYTKSSNKHDHGAELRVRVPKGIDAQIHAAVSNIPEYTSQQAFWRDAAVHRLEYLQKRYSISEEGRRFLELERLRADSDRRATDIEIMQETVSDITAKLQQAWDAQDYGMLAEELKEGDELIDWLRSPYREQVQRLLKEWRDQSRAKIAEYKAEHDE